MQKFTVAINIDIETIRSAYQQHFGTTKKPSKKDIAGWIASLAEADILDVASHYEYEEDD